MNTVVVTLEVIPAVNKLVVVSAFDAYKFPITCKFAVGVFVPIPMRLLVERNIFAVDAATPDAVR